MENKIQEYYKKMNTCAQCPQPKPKEVSAFWMCEDCRRLFILLNENSVEPAVEPDYI